LEFLKWLVKAYIDFLYPIKEYVLLSEFMVVSNYIMFSFTKSKKHDKPLWIFVFATYVLIVSTRLFDIYIDNQIQLCDKLSKTICYYQLFLITKNVGKLFGYDLTKFINKPK